MQRSISISEPTSALRRVTAARAGPGLAEHRGHDDLSQILDDSRLESQTIIFSFPKLSRIKVDADAVVELQHATW